MIDVDKSRAAQAAKRVAEWLTRDEETFKRDGVEEGTLADSLDMSAEDITAGVDYLENREEVVRFPHPSETPPRIVLKPGRGWAALRSEIGGTESAG